MKDAGGKGATQKLAKRKLDALGYVKSHCGLANGPERIKKLRRQAQLAASLAAIDRANNEEKKKKKTSEKTALLDSAPRAVGKLREKGGDVAKLKVKEIDAILSRYYATEQPKGNKAAHVKILMDTIASNPTAMEAADADRRGPEDGPEPDDEPDDEDGRQDCPDCGAEFEFDQGRPFCPECGQ